MTYVSRHEPWKHQREALAKLQGKKAFALLMAMRTGKTKTVLDDFGGLEADGKCQDLLVIAPGGVYRTWEKAISDHAGEELAQRVRVKTWRSGAGPKQQETLAEFLEGSEWARWPRILLMNIEALSVVKDARELAKTFLGQRNAMLVIDESTAIKNPAAKRTKFINRELKPLAMYRRILSGLPTPRSPLDLYSQFEFLDPAFLGFTSYYAFRARHAIMQQMKFGGRTVPVVVAYKGVEELQAKVAKHSHRVLLEDCYDLPKKMYTTREVPLTDEQKRIYKEIKEYATTQLESGDHVTATQVITQILRMHQVLCGHVGTELGEFREISELRTSTLLGLLREHDTKGIIWCSYDADVRKVADAIEKEFGKGSSAKFWGGNRPTRELEEKRFLESPDCRYIVATAAAGGRGRTWTVADLVVYYSNTADLEHRSQSEERAQGVDKARSVLYVDLVAPGTVDEKMLKTLRAKISMAATINGDTWREWLI